MENYKDTENELTAEALQSASGGASPYDEMAAPGSRKLMTDYPDNQIIIGGPLKKNIENQAKLAATTADFITRVGYRE